ncbi:unnamed protein product [Adineta steineri]|uniref:Uncharacterized protein n=1 Tax=Adineta steineri TaxID=433720 RepID=A0A814RRX0_9BILA|nr:unnamed protein product [Adineta steineri]CAF1137743.1 unnamed protein product [Adineta steineri]
MDLDGSFDFSSTDEIKEQSQLVYNSTVNGTLRSLEKDFDTNNDTMRLLFITIAIIIVLICITISTILFICICLNRRRNSRREEKQDQLLPSEQFEKIPDNRKSLINSSKQNINPTVPFHSTQQSIKKTLSSSSSINPNEKIQIRPYYYDNLDDIPFIDESRPTSFIDVTRV